MQNIQQPRLEIVAATRRGEAEFRAEAALAHSLRRLNDPRIAVRVACDNMAPLAQAYNRAIDETAADALVFIHDDVWIDDSWFAERIFSGLAQFDVLGVAGSRKRRPGQRAWSFVSDPAVRDDPEFLSGRVAQGEHPCGRILYFGPAPAACELLDGVLLAARTAALRERGVRFDPRFAFHYYDLDFCRAATAAGLRLGTWPVCITHQSPGGFTSEAWRAAGEAYFAKWGS